MSDLYVAAGGGGDPVGTLIAARALGGDAAGPPPIATYAWERPEVDPTATALGDGDFEGLVRETGDAGDGFAAFTPATRVRPPAGSTLPGLARDLPARLLLLDPAAGLRALARRLGSMAAAAGGRIRVVDIGGDILTHGDEPGLCSPFTDALTLAACHLTGIPTTVHVAGPGLDGEIEERTLLERLTGSDPPPRPGRGGGRLPGTGLAPFRGLRAVGRVPPRRPRHRPHRPRHRPAHRRLPGAVPPAARGGPRPQPGRAGPRRGAPGNPAGRGGRLPAAHRHRRAGERAHPAAPAGPGAARRGDRCPRQGHRHEGAARGGRRRRPRHPPARRPHPRPHLGGHPRPPDRPGHRNPVAPYGLTPVPGARCPVPGARFRSGPVRSGPVPDGWAGHRGASAAARRESPAE
ncbi:DUF1152 domain-containing protein [Streptomyces sp. SYP-A7193]|nr:DUF1152 domain-containing protein [Streptomyces sp. SYP-A7193]